MSYCGSCGVDVPDGQRICSVCYGDPYHGSDGYLLDMMRQDWEAQERAQEQEDSHDEPPADEAT